MGIIGAGYAASSAHLPVFLHLKQVRVVALCDKDLSKAKDLAQRYSIRRVYNDLDEMLQRETLNLLDICVPPQSHREVLMKALEAGLPCLVEKPFTVTANEADEIIKMAREKGLPIFPIYDHPYIPAVRKARGLVIDGVIGKLLGVHISYSEPVPARYLDSNHWCHSLPGDYFSDAEPHLAMLLVEFLGTVREVKAFATKTSSHTTLPMDVLSIGATFQDGTLGSITHFADCSSFFMEVHIVGTSGILHGDGVFNAIVHYGPRARLGNPWGLGTAFAKGIVSQSVALTKTTSSVLVSRYLLKTEPNAHFYLIPRALRALEGQEAYPVDLNKTRESVRLVELAFDFLKLQGLSQTLLSE